MVLPVGRIASLQAVGQQCASPQSAREAGADQEALTDPARRSANRVSNPLEFRTVATWSVVGVFVDLERLVVGIQVAPSAAVIATAARIAIESAPVVPEVTPLVTQVAMPRSTS